MDLLESNKQGIRIIYIVDVANGGCDGQYPETLMRIQKRQGYCLLLHVKGTDYERAWMGAVFYAKDLNGLWRENRIAAGSIDEFGFDSVGHLTFNGDNLDDMRKEAFERVTENAHKSISDDMRKLLDNEDSIREARMKALEDADRKECPDWDVNVEILRQDRSAKDPKGNRWIKCEYCGKIAMDNEFTFYGGYNRVNLGTCKECSANNPDTRKNIEIQKGWR